MIKDLCFALFLSIIVTFGYGYYFGEHNHYEQLPLIYHAIDHEYLKNDAMVMASDNFHPRYYATHIFATLGKIMPIWQVFLFLAILSHTGIAYITILVSREIFKAQKSTQYLSVIVIYASTSINLGGATYLHLPTFESGILGTMLGLGLFYSLVRKSNSISMILAFIGILIHPTVVLYGLITGFVYRILEKKSVMLDDFVVPILFLLLYVLLYQFRLDPYIDSHEFVSILKDLRIPHHISLPSMPLVDYLWTMIFSFIVIFYGKKREIIGIYVVILIFMVANYIFIEIWPSRLIALAQPLRILAYWKFLGLVLGVKYFNEHKSNISSKLPLLLLLLPILVIKRQMLVMCFAMTVLFIFLNIRNFRKTLSISLLLLFLFSIAIYHNDNLKPKLWLEADTKNMIDDIALATKSLTPTGSTVLTPPISGRYRLLAERAVVADFKSQVYSDSYLAEWKKRMINVYGDVRVGGFQGLALWDSNYKSITDERIIDLCINYGVDYAILYKDTSTKLLSIYENEEYKLVNIYQ